MRKSLNVEIFGEKTAKLPKLVLSKFDGSYMNWQKSGDSFLRQ